MKKPVRIVLFFGTLGLWPIWVAVVWVVWGAMQFQGSMEKYWNAAPWLIVGGIMASPITIGSALAAIYVFLKSSGGASRKYALAALTYIGIVVVVWTVLRAFEKYGGA